MHACTLFLDGQPLQVMIYYYFANSSCLIYKYVHIYTNIITITTTFTTYKEQQPYINNIKILMQWWYDVMMWVFAV